MNRLHPSPESAKCLRAGSPAALRPRGPSPSGRRRRPARERRDRAPLDQASLERLSVSELWRRFAEGANRTSLEDLRRIREAIQQRYFSLIPDHGQRPLAG